MDLFHLKLIDTEVILPSEDACLRSSNVLRAHAACGVTLIVDTLVGCESSLTR